METLDSIFPSLLFEIDIFHLFSDYTLCFLRFPPSHYKSNLPQTQHMHTLCDSNNWPCERGCPLSRTYLCGLNDDLPQIISIEDFFNLWVTRGIFSALERQLHICSEMSTICSLWGLHSGVVDTTVASQQEGSRFNSQLGPFCVEFACSSRVCVGSLRVLWLPPTVQKHVC